MVRGKGRRIGRRRVRCPSIGANPALEKPGENCFADRVTLGYRRVIAFEKMLLPRAAFEKKLLAGTLSLISKVTAASTATLRQSGCPEEEMMMFIIVLTKN